jgi:hypothetical protein
MLEAAREAGGADHHFRVLQLPMNLFESGAILERNNGPDHRETVLETAAREGIGVLVNRPLNAIVGNGMLRLADFQVGEAEVDLGRQLKFVADLEAEYRREIAPNISVPHGGGSRSPGDFFRWAEELDGLEERLFSLDHWQHIMGQMIIPNVSQAANGLNRILKGAAAEQWKSWWNRYFPALRELLVELGRRAGERSRAESRAVSLAIDPLLPPERREETLSRKAIWVLASTPGVTSILNGMRTAAYVEDALGVLPWPPLTSVLPVYQAVRSQKPPRGS